jgi:AraC-like DNA-binding protein
MTTQRPRRKGSHREHQRIERTIEMYLRECYRERTAARVSELAQLLGANRTYLSRVVPAVLGEPLGAALRTRQLAYAERLLRETTLTVGEIAASAAFGTERTFFRAFLGAYGTTPGAFRKATKCQ